MPTTPPSKPTVKDLLPLLTTTEDRMARIKAVLTPKRTVQTQQAAWLGVAPASARGVLGPLGVIPPGSLAQAWPSIQQQQQLAQQSLDAQMARIFSK